MPVTSLFLRLISLLGLLLPFIPFRSFLSIFLRFKSGHLFWMPEHIWYLLRAPYSISSRMNYSLYLATALIHSTNYMYCLRIHMSLGTTVTFVFLLCISVSLHLYQHYHRHHHHHHYYYYHYHHYSTTICHQLWAYFWKSVRYPVCPRSVFACVYLCHLSGRHTNMYQSFNKWKLR